MTAIRSAARLRPAPRRPAVRRPAGRGKARPGTAPTITWHIAPGFHIAARKAQIIGNALSQLVAESQNRLTPEVVVDAATPTDAVLHPYFTWDDDEAARKYRLGEAGYLLRAFEIEVRIGASKEPTRVRAFLNVNDEDGQAYGSTMSLPADVIRAYAMEGLHDLERWEQEFRGLLRVATFRKVVGPKLQALNEAVL